MTAYVIADIKMKDPKWVPAYAPFVSARQGGSDSRFQLIDNTDLAGTISYLPKG